MLEVEVKVKVDIVRIEPQLKALGFIKGSSVYERDSYFNGTHKDLKEEDKALRIREYRNLDTDKTKYIINFKGPKKDDITMTREETEFEIPSYEHGEIMLNGLGFYVAGGVEKVRTYYNIGNLTCCLDRVTNLGEFMELEIMAEEFEYDDAINNIKGILSSLNLDISQTIRESYLCLLASN